MMKSTIATKLWKWISVGLICAMSSPIIAQTFTDPVGDTVGNSLIKHDLLSVTGHRSQGSIVLEVALSDMISAPSLARARELTGFIDLDIDGNIATGVVATDQSFASSRGGIAALQTLGVEAYLDLFSEVQSPGTVDLVDASSRSNLGKIPIVYKPDTFELTIPLSLLNDDGLLNYGLVVGTFGEPTDELTGAHIVPEPAAVVSLAWVALAVGLARRSRTAK